MPQLPYLSILLFNWKAGIYLMIIMKGLECSLLVPNERENTGPEGL
jgi:hypothetical protein